ncbi:MAG: hypothetical protein AB1753_06870 [Thermoproteota archaeon]
MTSADLRHKRTNYSSKAFLCYCPVCQKTNSHEPILTAFIETDKGPAIRKAGYCKECWERRGVQTYNEKILVIKPVRGAVKQEFCLVS